MASGAERGQATAEYVALLLLVAMALAAAGVAVADPGLGRSLLFAMRRALCVVSGLDCERRSQPCVVESRSDRDRAAVTVAVLRLGGDAAVLRERRSDGSVAVTLLEGGSAGADVGFGGRLRIPARGLDVGADLRVVGVAALGGGRTWVVRGDAAADRLIARLGRRGRRPLVGGVIGLAREALGKQPEFPPPDSTVLDFSTRRSASTTFGDGLARAGFQVRLDDTVGIRSERRRGRRTYFVREDRVVTPSLRSKLLSASLRVPGRGFAEAAGSLVLGLTVDRRGNPVELSVDTEGSLAASRGVVGGGDAGPPAGEGQRASGERLEVQARLDLRDPENAAAARRLLGALRRPDRPGELLASTRALGDRLLDYSDVEARTYRVDGSTSGAAGGVKVGGGLGADIQRARERARLVGAWDRAPGGVWQARRDCLRVAAAAAPGAAG
jgi:hypothetical protein